LKASVKPCPDLLTRHALFFLLLLAGINGFAQRPANGSLVQVQTNVTQNDPSLISFPHTGSSQLLLRKGDTLLFISRDKGFYGYQYAVRQEYFCSNCKKTGPG
jgi:hypothetical protein